MIRFTSGRGFFGGVAPACLLQTLWFAAVPALAQGPQPAGPAASAPALAYRSAFAGYKPYEAGGEVTPSAWRSANDEVGRIGGWRTYAKEASQPEAAEPARAGAPAARQGGKP